VVRLSRLLVLLGVVFPALAANPLPIVVDGFGTEEDSEAVRREVELLLELDPALLLSGPKGLHRELGGNSTDLVDPDDLADALVLIEQAAVVYGTRRGENLVVLARRADDGALVFVERAPQRGTAEERAAVLVKGLAPVLRTLATAPALAEDLVPPRQGDESSSSAGDRVARATAPNEDESPPLATTRQTPRDASDDTRVSARAADRLGRVSFSLAPGLFFYEACQPTLSGERTPRCTEGVGPPPSRLLITPLGAPLGISTDVSLFPLSDLGVEVLATLMWTRLTARDNDGAVSALSPNPSLAATGDLVAAGVWRMRMERDDVTADVGARLGYRLAWATSERIMLRTNDVSRPFPLLPSYQGHQGVAGVSLQVSPFPSLRLALDTDALVGTHLESDGAVGNDPFALGARAKGSAQLDVAKDLFVNVFSVGSALLVTTSGTAASPRYTRELKPFDSGQITLLDLRFGVGLGYRY
ncbi:MAG: hypothetical protein ACO3JL_09010, partial [Myxococcota bacterium]